jgi:hypothetical protein
MIAFCENCGGSLREGARFCSACGAVMPADRAGGEPTAIAPQAPTSWSCRSCGSLNRAKAVFCSRCGWASGAHERAHIAADGPTVRIPAAAIARGPAVAVDGRSTSSRASRRTLVIALAVAVALVLVALAAFVMVTRNGAGAQKSIATLPSPSDRSAAGAQAPPDAAITSPSAGSVERGGDAGNEIVSAGGDHTVGLCADGTAVEVGSNDAGQHGVSSWRALVAVSAGLAIPLHTVGLCAAGTAVAVGSNDAGQCDVSSWSDLIAVSAGEFYTVGLRADGTAVAVGSTSLGQCDVSSWRDLIAVSAGNGHTVGLRADGTVVAVGNNESGQCDVSLWKLATPAASE